MNTIPISSDDWPKPPKLRTVEYQRVYQPNYRRAKKLAGFCHHCLHNKSGFDNGTKTLCGPCRRAHHVREEKRRRAQGIKPRTFSVIPIHRQISKTAKKPSESDRIDKMMQLTRRPTRNVTWLELSVGRSNS